MILLLSHPLLSPSAVSKLNRRHAGRLRKRDNLLTGERGRGWGRSQIIQRRDCPVLSLSFNTHWHRYKREEECSSVGAAIAVLSRVHSCSPKVQQLLLFWPGSLSSRSKEKLVLCTQKWELLYCREPFLNRGGLASTRWTKQGVGGKCLQLEQMWPVSCSDF